MIKYPTQARLNNEPDIITTIPDRFHLSQWWPIEPVVAFTELAGGTNNRVWQVQTQDGSAYVLRLTDSAHPGDVARFRYETALLTALRSASLPFALPCCLPTRNGKVFLQVKRNHETPAIATLSTFFRGTVPERTAVNIARAGRALAQLDRALAAIPADSLPANAETASFQYGSLYHCHPLVPEPFVTAEQLLEPELARPFSQILRRAQNDWETLCAKTLPRQILHRDCGPGNVLMDQGRVTAILDFEFAGTDRRIFDLCVAISWWPVRVMGTGQEWELIDAFGQAYTSVLPLTDDELLALPAALRLRDVTSLIYRLGRHLAGLETQETIQQRAQHSLWRDSWLAANGETLVQHALKWKTARLPQNAVA